MLHYQILEDAGYITYTRTVADQGIGGASPLSPGNAEVVLDCFGCAEQLEHSHFCLEQTWEEFRKLSEEEEEEEEGEAV